ncbi:MAG TPA: tRNA dihydrouridine(20/20a) synthase DusA, partial [Gammaproteobacteria bacterium]|nr:tRNA dihydrouridine(20/20a) synthase DusA [Gammaproteobacteria bacterium]
QLSPHAWLYTEMITVAALIRGPRERLLAFHADEHPVALQLGGSDPVELAAAAALAAAAGFDEVNLNVGCPSDRVRAGCFGAALMAQPATVAACVRAMRDACDVPVTVKTRLGIDDLDSYGFLREFAAAIAGAGCETLIVHARKAWLSGLSPKENREVPPLDYARVHRLKRDFPALEIIINGGIDVPDVALAQLDHVDGVMLGRAAYREPYVLAELESRLFGSRSMPRRETVLAAMVRYAEHELAAGARLRSITRHLMGLYAGLPGARQWRRLLVDLDDSRAGLETLRQFVSARQAA